MNCKYFDTFLNHAEKRKDSPWGVALDSMKAMKTLFGSLFAFTFCLFLSGTALAEGPWETNIEEAVKKAKAEGKLVMVEFTGSEWCPPCIMMNKEVFSKQEFLDGAQKDYVLVKIDVPKPGSDNNHPSVKLMTQYKVQGVPTVILLDAESKEFTRFSAAENNTVESFLKRLAQEKRRKDMI